MGFYDAAKSAIKDALRLAQQSDNIELIEKILAAQSTLLDAQEREGGYQEAIRDRDETIRAFNEKLRIRGSLKFETNVYWMVGDDGSRGGPFCSTCWDNRDKLIRLHQDDPRFWTCRVCKSSIDKPGRSDRIVRDQNSGYDPLDY